MIRQRLLALSAALLLMMTGCYDFDYTGQYFEPIPEGEPVKFYHTPDEVPPGVYRVIGRAEIAALTGQLDSYDVEDILLDKARSCGAEAVALVTSRLQHKGFYHRDMTAITRFSGADISGGMGKLEDNSTATVNSFKTAPEITSERNYQEVLAVQALFYKRQSVLSELMADPVGDLESFVSNTSEDDPQEPAPANEEAPVPEETEDTALEANGSEPDGSEPEKSGNLAAESEE